MVVTDQEEMLTALSAVFNHSNTLYFEVFFCKQSLRLMQAIVWRPALFPGLDCVTSPIGEAFSGSLCIDSTRNIVYRL
jgi:hypothetical protein